MASHDTVRIEARPEPFGLDLSHAVRIDVDVQNDFGPAGGMFHRAGIDIARSDGRRANRSCRGRGAPGRDDCSLAV